jgi:hypothetical protein
MALVELLVGPWLDYIWVTGYADACPAAWGTRIILLPVEPKTRASPRVGQSWDSQKTLPV